MGDVNFPDDEQRPVHVIIDGDVIREIPVTDTEWADIRQRIIADEKAAVAAKERRMTDLRIVAAEATKNEAFASLLRLLDISTEEGAAE